MTDPEDIRATVRQVVREELADLLAGLAAQLRAEGGVARAGHVGAEPGVSHAGGGPTDPVLIAIITAAAVAAMGGAPVRVRRITYVNHNTISGWAESGRLGIHASHNLRKGL